MSSNTNYTPVDINTVSNSKPQFFVATSATNSTKKTRFDFVNIFLIIAVVSFVGSFSYALQVNQTASSARAGATTLDTANPYSLLLKDKELTKDIKSYPTSYNNKAIPNTLVADGMKKFVSYPEANRKEFIMNRIAMFYILKDALDSNSITYPDSTQPVTFDLILRNLPEMEKLVNKNLVSSADYGYVEDTFNKDPNQPVNPDAEAKAREMITAYQERIGATKNVEEIKKIVNAAPLDPELIQLDNYGQGAFITDYTADQNDIQDQSAFIFDEEFDDILFKLEPNKVSDIVTLTSTQAYKYVVIYPTRIDIKKYSSLKQLVAEKSSLFQY